MDVLREQYEWIRATREVLFAFLEEIPLDVLHKEVPNFGSGSILRTHLHVADCYRYWLGSFAMKQRRADFPFTSEEDIARADVARVRERFQQADKAVQRFMAEYEGRWFEKVSNEVKWQAEPWSTTPLWLLTHTETHEFHHKGQIVAMARNLGYAPPETDLVEVD